MHRTPSAIKGSAALSAWLCVLLTACGGGGGGDAAPAAPASNSAPVPAPAPSPAAPPASAPAPTPATAPVSAPAEDAFQFPVMPAPAGAPAGVFISEVANNYYANTVSWLEVFNNTGAPIDLSRYSLRTSAINPNSLAVSDNVTFALPQRTLPHNSYMVIGARASGDLQDSGSHVYIANADGQVPYWQGLSGFAELQSGGTTVDFVRFGTSTMLPATASAWSGPSVPAMSGSTTSYNTSIVRAFSLFKQTRTAGDWSWVSFATPGGINDVVPGVTDSDGDGIPDSAKRYGGTYAGLDLYAMGARPGQRDLFIHLDYLNSSDPGATPDIRALDKIAQVFRKQNIALHFDVGNLFSPDLQPERYNLSGNISHQRANQRCTQLQPASKLQAGCTSVYATKTANMDVRRKPIFRYLLMANSQLPSGQGDASGSAELEGDDFLVTLSGWGLQKDSWLLANYQAATIMHELGHTLGLHHGGNEDESAKPNYFSIMNYFYQVSGLPSLTGSSLTQRYYYWLSNYRGQSVPGYPAPQRFPASALDDGPYSASFRIDYSDGSGQPLDENHLDESALAGRGKIAGSFVDWNLNGQADAGSYAWDINQSGSKTAMSDYNDWAKLLLNPHRVANANNSGIMLPGSRRAGGFNPLTMPFQPLQTENRAWQRLGLMQRQP